MLGTDLTEFHSGYRAYDTGCCAQIPFEANSDGFDFDTQIIAQLLHAGGRIVESRSRPTTATRSATSTACSTPATWCATCCEFQLAIKGFGTHDWVPSAARSTTSRRATAPRTR